MPGDGDKGLTWNIYKVANERKSHNYAKEMKIRERGKAKQKKMKEENNLHTFPYSEMVAIC